MRVCCLGLLLTLAGGCGGPAPDLPESALRQPPSAGEHRKSARTAKSEDFFGEARLQMVRRQIQLRGVHDPRVLAAMRNVPRHEFMPPEVRHLAYFDRPVEIGHGQTISQPYIVAAMTEALGLRGDEKLLEVGTGSGYQAAVLAEIAPVVYSIEIVGPLGRRAEQTLRKLGYDNVHVRIGDGYQGWPEHAPFDAVIVTAAPDHVPQPLIDQLEPGGRLVIPVGKVFQKQELLLLTKTADGVVEKRLMPVSFVPMTGEARHAAPKASK